MVIYLILFYFYFLFYQNSYALEANIIYQCVISHLKSSIKKDVENYHALYQSGKATEVSY